MLCPVCDTKLHAKNTRDCTDLYGVTYRYYKCTDCKVSFKSSEKIVFNTLPSRIKEKFLSEGVRERK